MTIEELLQSEDISKVVSELRNGRLSVEPNTKEHVAQYDPKMHDINDTQKRPDKLVVIDKDSNGNNRTGNSAQAYQVQGRRSNNRKQQWRARLFPER